MRIDVCMRVDDLQPELISATCAVVFDVLRATSTIITALANGCSGVIPVTDTEDAIARAHQNRHQGLATLLGGERGGRKLTGFDTGNSPLEYSGDVIAGKFLILTTTNGTRTIEVCKTASNVYMGSLLNARAVARRLYNKKSDVTLVCAGTKGRFSLEDAVAAGLVMLELKVLASKDARKDKLQMTDAATAVALLAAGYEKGIGQCLYDSAHGQRLLQLGFDEDLVWCGKANKFSVVPVLDRDKGLITL